MSSHPLVLPQEGAIIEGKYRVERFLKSGGMGAIALSEHIQLRQKVVLKFLLPTFATELGSVERFIREAKHAAHVKSARAVRVIDVSTTPDGTPYIVMEYLQGNDLAAELARRGSIPVQEAVDCVLATCEAIAAAHKQGIVHRDIKPANLFLVKDGESEPGVKVLDFGIAKSLDVDNKSLAGNTETHSMLGTPAYMSPEQLRSAKTVDERTDIWALGIVLYELIAGERPFDGASPAEVCAAIFRDPPTPIRKKRAEVPTKLAHVIERCLEKNREDRYPTVGALSAALLPFAGSRGKQSFHAIEEAMGTIDSAPTRRFKKRMASLVLLPLLAIGSAAIYYARPPLLNKHAASIDPVAKDDPASAKGLAPSQSLRPSTGASAPRGIEGSPAHDVPSAPSAASSHPPPSAKSQRPSGTRAAPATKGSAESASDLFDTVR